MILGLLVLSACGGNVERGAGSGSRSCRGSPLSSSEIKLPSDFPIPRRTVLTTTTKAELSDVVEGYYEGDLALAYNAWKEALEDAGYTVLYDEIEDEDSEIAYKSADESSTGQIALRAQCEESGRIFVHITNRPS